MEFRSIPVNLDVDSRSSDLSRVAIDLAERFGAEIAAVAGALPATDLIALEGSAVAVGAYDAERKQLEDRPQGLEVDFIARVPAKLRGGCVTLLAAPTEIVATAARRADLILVGSSRAAITSSTAAMSRSDRRRGARPDPTQSGRGAGANFAVSILA